MRKLKLNIATAILLFAGNATLTYSQVVSEEQELYHLAQSITSHCTSEKQKLDSIVYWISKNISYDYSEYKLFLEGEASPATIRSVLEDKKAVCDGYALLTKGLLQHCGLEAVTIAGYGRNSTALLFADTSLLAHEWNAVKINGRWQLIDATWTDVSLEAGDSSLFFCNTDPEKFIWTHYPDDRKWSLLTNPPSLEEFLDRPLIFWDAIANNGLQVPEAPTVLEKNVTTSADFIFIPNKFLKKYDVQVAIDCISDENAPNGDIIATDNPKRGFRITLPQPGTYLLNIGIRLPTDAISLETYTIIAAKIVRTEQ